MPPNKRLKKYFDKYGIFKGYWKLKIEDYKRLIQIAEKNNGKIPKRVSNLYSKTICGEIMDITYKIRKSI